MIIDANADINDNNDNDKKQSVRKRGEGREKTYRRQAGGRRRGSALCLLQSGGIIRLYPVKGRSTIVLNLLCRSCLTQISRSIFCAPEPSSTHLHQPVTMMDKRQGSAPPTPYKSASDSSYPFSCATLGYLPQNNRTCRPTIHPNWSRFERARPRTAPPKLYPRWDKVNIIPLHKGFGTEVIRMDAVEGRISDAQETWR